VTDADADLLARVDHFVAPADDVGRRIVDSSEDCLKILDLDGRIHYVNSAGVRHMELRHAGEMLGRPWIEFWDAADRAAAATALASARDGQRGVFQGLSRTSTGVPKWWDVAVTPITAADGAVVQLLAVARDRTDRRREEAFRAGQHGVLEMIATGAPLDEILAALILLIERQCDDVRGSVVLLDQRSGRMRHGVAPSLPGLFVPGFEVPIGPSAGSCGTAIFLGEPVVVSDALVDPVWEGARDIARRFGFRGCWSTPVRSSQRVVLGAFGLYAAHPRLPTDDELRLMDIGAYLAGIAIERQQADAALQQSEERNRAILRAIPDWMFVMSADGVFLDYHARDAKALLVPPEVFLGRSVHDVMPPPIAAILSAAFARTLATDEPEKVEYSIGADAAEQFFESTVVPVDGDKVLAIVRDISDRRRAELDAATQRGELAHLHRVAMLGELTGTLAHELSQPLTAILSNAEAARRLLEAETPDLGELRGALDDIIRSDTRAGAVIDRLRTLLKKGAYAPQPLSLNDVAREVHEVMASDLRARRILVTRRLAAALPLVNGDRVQLQQVLINLVLNACEAMEDVGPAERHLTLETSADGTAVEIAVVDNGLGIANLPVDAIFEPFVTSRANGLGLGLAISRSIVHAHGGRIAAANNPGRGATLRCRFPVGAPAATA
jgi:PAS domain S-box-containing protein